MKINLSKFFLLTLLVSGSFNGIKGIPFPNFTHWNSAICLKTTKRSENNAGVTYRWETTKTIQVFGINICTISKQYQQFKKKGNKCPSKEKHHIDNFTLCRVPKLILSGIALASLGGLFYWWKSRKSTD